MSTECCLRTHINYTSCCCISRVDHTMAVSQYAFLLCTCVLVDLKRHQKRHQRRTKYCSNSKFTSHRVRTKYPGCVLAPPILPGMHRRRLVWTWVSYLSQNAFGEKKKKSVLPFSRPPGVRTSNRTPQVQTSEVHKYGLGVLGIEKRPLSTHPHVD